MEPLSSQESRTAEDKAPEVTSTEHPAMMLVPVIDPDPVRSALIRWYREREMEEQAELG
jgi:hypothetical protein